MPSLHINEFSCIDSAELDISKINIIIGPQGSGKSVTTKMLNFCADIPLSFVGAAEKGLSFSDYKKFLGRQFTLWFPPQAWGGGRSKIAYLAGDFSVRILRRTRHSRPSDEVAIKFSDWFEHAYNNAVLAFNTQNESLDRQPTLEAGIFEDPSYRTREKLMQDISKVMGSEYISGQTFVPAGRAFFTSIGRLVAGFEHAGALDPVTLKFARLFANLRDRIGNERFLSRRSSDEAVAKRRLFMQSMFGGQIKNDGETEFVEAADGRKIPFTSLSSGQQELLPIWSLVDFYLQQDEYLQRSRTRASRLSNQLIYIEEPEAHLFPSAQSMLMELLIGELVGSSGRSIMLTTHSPYVLSKLNVFLKAGQLARRKKKNQAINEIVPRSCWVDISEISAYAIKDRKLVSIIDLDEELIDAEYLDEISGDIALDYSSLLEIEAGL